MSGGRVGALSTTALCLAVASNVSATPPRTVPCSESILSVASGRSGGYRVVLGVASVPPPYRRQVVRTGKSLDWPYFGKAGIAVRGRTVAELIVPPAWRERVAFTWGNRKRPAGRLRVASCGSNPEKPWNAYAGGFYLRARAACFPLMVRVGSRRTTVWFGLGRRC
jgi:hypothetical protein